MARAKSHNSVRIIGGKLRSRRIEFPDAPGLRPTGDRIRETLFNWLQADILGARCLDPFAGSGVLGLEAVSRGASSVILLDRNPRVIAALQDSIALLQLDNAIAIQADAQQWLQQPRSRDQAFDIVFLDPPFSEELLLTTCGLLAQGAWLQSGARIYLESPAAIDSARLPTGWRI
ncbi:MAG: 16S rRNA (guanine(966)-N(2))-methyltransferase RsmD, partial [Gammaproteobacteria bacterium]